MPGVSMAYEVRRSDGSLVTRDPASLVQPTAEGGVSRLLVGFSLENASPGEYELVMRVRDEFSGETRVLREPFRVVAR